MHTVRFKALKGSAPLWEIFTFTELHKTFCVLQQPRAGKAPP